METLSIDQLKNDIAKVREELPLGVTDTSDKRVVLTPDQISNAIPKKKDPNEINAKDLVAQEIAAAKSVVYGRIKQEIEESRQLFEEEELYEKGLDEEDDLSDNDESSLQIDDILYDDSDEIDNNYTQKIKLEDHIKMGEEVKVEEATAPTVDEQTSVEEMPRMKKKEKATEVNTTPSNEQASKKETVTITKEKETIEETMFMSDDDFDDDEEDSLDSVNNESERKERVAHVRSVVKQAYEESLNRVDLSKFTISKKPVTVSNALASSKPIIRVADWVLHSTKTCVSVSQLSGPEIEGLDVNGSSRGLYNAYLDMYKILYKHIENPNKGSLEQWLKTISFYDLQDLYFAFYRACYGKDNNILYTCEHCKETYMAKKPIEDMVKFKNDEIAATAKAIMNKGVSNTEPEYKTDMVQITNDYAVTIRVPSVYDATLAPALLPDDWRQKYSDLISTCTFIDAIYRINRTAGTLEPISTNPVANDDVKTMKNKLKAFNKIFSTFTSNEYAKLKGVISNLGTDMDEIEYYIPSEICKKCGKEIPKQLMDPLQMLFTYHQLGQAAYISEN